MVPVKPLDRAKSRLAGALAADERRALSRALLEHVLEVLAASHGLTGVAVVSRDPQVLALAAGRGARAIRETGRGLNRALEQGIAWVRDRDAQAALIVPADLPRLTPHDIAAVLALADVGPVVVIAPCRRSTGTNLLLLRPPDVIPPSFGANSFQRHLQVAEAAGAHVQVYRSPTCGLDIDLVTDLHEWQSIVQSLCCW
jgi:2-phospho-L-lactate guanylyltransferase